MRLLGKINDWSCVYFIRYNIIEVVTDMTYLSRYRIASEAVYRDWEKLRVTNRQLPLNVHRRRQRLVWMETPTI